MDVALSPRPCCLVYCFVCPFSDLSWVGEECEDKRVSISFLIFLQSACLFGKGIFQAAHSLNCFGGGWSWAEIRLQSGRMALFTKFPACHRPRSTPQQLEFVDVCFQHGLQTKRFCFSAICLQRNQEGVGGGGGGREEVAYSGPRAVAYPDSEVKADTESDLSSTSHFSELCLLSPFRGQCACRQRAEAAVLLDELPYLPHVHRGAKKRGWTEKPSKTRANGQSLGAAAALPNDGDCLVPNQNPPFKKPR